MGLLGIGFLFLLLVPTLGRTTDDEQLIKLLPEVLKLINESGEARNACLLDSDKSKECTEYYAKLPATEARKLKNAIECFSKKNPADCAEINIWLRRNHSENKKLNQDKLKKAITDNIDLFQKHSGALSGCFTNFDQIEKNLCLITKNNLDDIEIRKHLLATPKGEKANYSEWFVLKTNDKNLEYSTLVVRLSNGLRSMLIVKTGHNPQEGGKNNTVGTISFVKKKIKLQNATLASEIFDYYGRTLKDSSLSYGKDYEFDLPKDKSYCDLLSNPGDVLTESIDKIASGWTPQDADKIALEAYRQAVETGIDIGLYNFQDAARNFWEGIKGLGKLAVNAEVPDPKGTEQCIEEENKKVAAQFGNTCSGIWPMLGRMVQGGADKIVGTCYRQHCPGSPSSKTEMAKCIANAAANPVFQTKMGVCIGYMLNQELGPKIKNLIEKCTMQKGADEFSRCMTNVSIIAASAAATGGAFQVMNAAKVGGSALVQGAVKAGQLTSESAKWLSKAGTVIRIGATFTVDIVLNPLPTNPADLVKVRKGLLTLLKEKNVPKDVVEIAQNRIKEIEKIQKLNMNSERLDRTYSGRTCSSH
jgi:hypothetical protein